MPPPVRRPAKPPEATIPDSPTAGGRALPVGEEVDGRLRPVPFAELAAAHPEERPAVVEGIVREGETANIIAPPKVGKSWLTYGLALSVANGKPWLGKFVTRKGRVLLIDNELHRETIVARVRMVAKETGLDPSGIHVVSLRGRLTDYAGLWEQLASDLTAGSYAAVIVDAHYRMLPSGTSENDNGAIKDVYNLIDLMAEHSRAAWFLMHHSGKGDQSSKETTDVGAGAGAQSRAADAHLILRPHKEKGTYVLDGAVRSFPAPPALVVRWKFPVMEIDLALNPAELKTPETAKQQSKDAKDKGRVLNALPGPTATKPITLNSLRANLGMERYRCERFLKELIAEGKAAEVEWEASGNRTSGYRKL